MDRISAKLWLSMPVCLLLQVCAHPVCGVSIISRREDGDTRWASMVGIYAAARGKAHVLMLFPLQYAANAFPK